MSKKSVELAVLNPRGKVEARSSFAPNPRVKELSSKRVGLYSNGKPGMDNFYTVFEELLKKKYPTMTVKLLTGSFEITDRDAKDWAPQIDTFVYAVGD
jgi:hypothetical protein